VFAFFLCVCACVFVCVCLFLCVCVCVDNFVRDNSVSCCDACIRIYVHIYMCIHIYEYVYKNTYIPIHPDVYMFLRVCFCMFEFVIRYV